jgi:hypothetical protein
MILDASRHTVIVHDVTAQRSWLVPKLGVLIHMAHIWSKENGLADPIPFVEPYEDGGAILGLFQGREDLVLCG